MLAREQAERARGEGARQLLPRRAAAADAAAGGALRPHALWGHRHADLRLYYHPCTPQLRHGPGPQARCARTRRGRRTHANMHDQKRRLRGRPTAHTPGGVRGSNRARREPSGDARGLRARSDVCDNVTGCDSCEMSFSLCRDRKEKADMGGWVVPILSSWCKLVERSGHWTQNSL